jgi:sortase A
MKHAHTVERLLLVAGSLLLAVYVSALIHGKVLADLEIAQFVQAQMGAEVPNTVGARNSADPVDFALWSKARIANYKESFKAHFAPPLALLSIPKVHLIVPLLEGTDELTLNRAVGHIPGTARPGGDGNSGIAGHRDGFFRALKDIHVGDEVTLALANASVTYIVDRISIVDPGNVSVLRSVDGPALTLVTCYPFYFVGSAPQRYIVHASLAKEVPRAVAVR